MTDTLVYVSPDMLIETHIDLAKKMANKQLGKFGRLIEKDEILSLCYEALITSAKNWNDYCARKGYDPEATEYFGYYSSRRMIGAIQDEARKKDSTSRAGRQWIKEDEANNYEKLPTRFVRRKSVPMDEKVDIVSPESSEAQVMLSLMVDQTIKTLENMPRAYAIGLTLNHMGFKKQDAVWASIRVIAAYEVTKQLSLLTEIKCPELKDYSSAQKKAKNKVDVWEDSPASVDDDLYFVGNAYVDYFYDSLREEPTLIFEIVKLLNYYFKKS